MHEYITQGHCAECKSDYQRRYYQENKDRIRIRKKRTDAEWYPKNRWRVRGYTLKRRQAVFDKIAKFHGDNAPRCRIDLTPETPVSDLPCRGVLTLDHINGNGRKDARGSSLAYAILKGDRKMDDIRLLCQLHQLWNQIRAIHE